MANLFQPWFMREILEALFYRCDTHESFDVTPSCFISATLQDHLVGEEIIVDYMLFKLNRVAQFS